MLKKVAIAVGAVLAALIVVVGAYVTFLELNYYRIDDNLSLEVENNQSAIVSPGQQYTIATYNVGFGAYSPAFSFFCDFGMLNGKETVGERATALSKADVERNTAGEISVVSSLDPDFVLLQEVDTGSTREYYVNQLAQFESSFADYSRTYGVNSHTAFFVYPVTDMYGTANSGLLTLSRYHADSALRRSYPISSSFIEKYVDLDRCFTVVRYPVEGGKELVVVNTHMSAYDEGNSSKQQQMDILNDFLTKEAAAGNYVIVGGDWNQSFIDYTSYETQETLSNQILLTNDSFADGYHIAYADNRNEVATCRNADIPYEKGVSLRLDIDGFVVSDNIEAIATNVDTEFAYSDHNPVSMRFILR